MQTNTYKRLGFVLLSMCVMSVLSAQEVSLFSFSANIPLFATKDSLFSVLGYPPSVSSYTEQTVCDSMVKRRRYNTPIKRKKYSYEGKMMYYEMNGRVGIYNIDYRRNKDIILYIDSIPIKRGMKMEDFLKKAWESPFIEAGVVKMSWSPYYSISRKQKDKYAYCVYFDVEHACDPLEIYFELNGKILYIQFPVLNLGTHWYPEKEKIELEE